jgi:DNA methylase/ParB-like nuclease family protein
MREEGPTVDGGRLFHEVTTMFPPMTMEEFDLLVADIRCHGLQEPLWRYQGQIIDGTHRYRACIVLGIEPHYREWEGQEGSLVRFVVSRNLPRRHLSGPQKAVVALEIEHQLSIEARKNKALVGGDHRSLLQKVAKAIDPLHAAEQAAAAVGTNHYYVTDVKKIVTLAPDLKDPMKRGELGIADAKVLVQLPQPQRAATLQMKTQGQVKSVKAAVLCFKRAEIEAQAQLAPSKPQLTLASWQEWLPKQEPCDLLLTDPPYSTDIDDIEAFAQAWLPLALAKVKPTGRAYICIGAYPRELRAYLTVPTPLPLAQVLVWEYKNTLGPSPTREYKQNWQAILYFYGPDAPPLDCPLLTEQFSVQTLNAPDGRLGERYHAWQKPQALGEQLIRHSTRSGDVVSDPFCGTGTFVLAAQHLGRIGRGCDISPDMLAIAEKRGCAICETR